MTKVVHVHLIFEKKDYYFGSITAIFGKESPLNSSLIGMTKETLLHYGLTDGSSVLTKRAIIKQSHLIRSRKDSEIVNK